MGASDLKKAKFKLWTAQGYPKVIGIFILVNSSINTNSLHSATYVNRSKPQGHTTAIYVISVSSDTKNTATCWTYALDWKI